MRQKLIIVWWTVFFLYHLPAFTEENNPPTLLLIEGLGNGYSTPAITSERIFVTGEQDGTGYLFAFDFNGNLIWKTQYGQEWTVSFRGSRAAPVVIDSLIYTLSGMGISPVLI